jgi:hypothetical protein
VSGLQLDSDAVARIARQVRRTAACVRRLLAGTDDGPEARQVRAMAEEAISRLPASRRIVTVNGRNAP